LVRTIRLEAENLTDTFCPDTFDLVYARNCIDHTYNPERAILQMISVVKRNRYVLMEHKPNDITAMWGEVSKSEIVSS